MRVAGVPWNRLVSWALFVLMLSLLFLLGRIQQILYEHIKIIANIGFRKLLTLKQEYLWPNSSIAIYVIKSWGIGNRKMNLLTTPITLKKTTFSVVKIICGKAWKLCFYSPIKILYKSSNFGNQRMRVRVFKPLSTSLISPIFMLINTYIWSKLLNLKLFIELLQP